MNMKNESSYFKTSDLALTTALSLFYPISSIDRLSSRAIFSFERQEGLDQIIQMYWRRELKVEPQAFFQQLKMVKTRLYEQR